MNMMIMGQTLPAPPPLMRQGVTMGRNTKGRLGDGATNPTSDQIARGKAFAVWLKAAIERAGINGKVLADKSGVSPTYIYDLLHDGLTAKGIYKRPSEVVIRAISDVTGADVRDGLAAAGYDTEIGRAFTPRLLASLPIDSQLALSQFIESLPSTILPLGGSDTLLIPVVGAVGAGTSVFAAENIRERIAIPRQMVNKQIDEGEVFAVRVQGDCLLGLYICDGDLLICRHQDHASDRDIVIVIEGEDAIAKRYRETPTRRWVETVPLNGRSEQVPLGPEARIIGVRVGLFRGSE